MKSNWIISIMVFLILTSYVSTYVLKNGHTKVPVKSYEFKNKDKYDNSLLQIIDTSVVYEEFDAELKKPKRTLSTDRSIYSIYRFYPDGKVNLFVAEEDSNFKPEKLNPKINGYRGVYYKENGIIKVDLFTLISGAGTTGTKEYNLKFKGDKLIVGYDSRYPDVYIKRKLPKKYMQFTADW